MYANEGAFAALKTDGSVVTWGDSSKEGDGSPFGDINYGGDSSSVASSLSSGVKAIYSAEGAFAALKTDGSVVTWGESHNGGDSSSLASSLSGGVVSLSKSF